MLKPPRQRCASCSPGCRRPSRSAATPTATGSNGRSRTAACATRRRCHAWLADILRHGAGRNDAILFLPSLARGRGRRCRPPAHHRRARRRLPALARAPPGIDRPGPRLPHRRLGGLAGDRLTALASLSPPDAALPYPVAVALCRRRPRHPGAAGARRHAQRLRRQRRLGRRARHPHRPDRRPQGRRRARAASSTRSSPAAATASLDDLGGAALRADIASMKHETQYTRLFRS